MASKTAQKMLLAFCVMLQWSLVLAQKSTNSTTPTPASNSTTAPKNATAVDPVKASKSAAIALAKKRKDYQNHMTWGIVRAFIWLWVSLLALFTISLLTVIFRRYLRTMSSLSPGNNQVYFNKVNWHWGMFKKHFMYAPLINKRHHRPFMLNRTTDNGCLPSRPQMTLIISYFILLVIGTFYGIDYKMPRIDVIVALERRMGTLALSQFAPLILLAARNNPLIDFTGISFDMYNLFHRWLGRFIVLEIIGHAICYFVKKVGQEGWKAYRKSMKVNPLIQAGTINLICLLLILIQSPAPIRHKFYETFLHLHQLLAAVLMWGLWAHTEGYAKQRALVKGIIAIWVIERSWRLLRLLYRNVGKPITSVEVEIMSPIAMRLKVRLTRPWHFTPGQHAYIYMPSVGWWTAHPFSVAWTDEDMGLELSEKESLPSNYEDITTRKRNIYFLVRRMKGFTDKLYVKAQKNGGKLTAKALVEGPYNQQTLHSFGTVVLVAAGIGITHIVPHVHDLVRGYSEGTVATRRVLMIWSVRTLEELELIREWMAIVLAIPRRNEILRIMIYAFQLDDGEFHSPSKTIQVFPGIAKFGPIIDEEVRNSVGSIGISVCGIGVVADEVRHACRKHMDKVNIDFMEESFSW